MVRQGGYKLRFHRQLYLVVATFLTLALVTSIAAPLHATTSDAIPDAPKEGFSRDSSYYSQVATLRYITSPDVHEVRFSVRNHGEDNQIDKLTAENVTPDDVTSHKHWQAVDVPTQGEILVAQIKKKDAAWQDVASHTVKLAPVPSLTIKGYDAIRGGKALQVSGGIEGEIFERVKFSASLVADDDLELSKTTLTRTDDTLRGELSLPDALDGDYRVVIRMVYESNEIDAVDTSVALMTHKPTLTLHFSKDTLYANEPFEVYSAPAASVPIESVALTYADQTVPMVQREDGAYGTAFAGGLASGTYDFSAVVRDKYGNVSDATLSAQQKFLVLRVVTTIKDDEGLLPVVPLKPAVILSTDFEPAVTRSTRDVPRDSDSSEERASVLGVETNALRKIVDLKPNEVPDAPVDTSQDGWRVFGAPWYTWLTGGAATWAGVFAIRWWFRRG